MNHGLNQCNEKIRFSTLYIFHTVCNLIDCSISPTDRKIYNNLCRKSALSLCQPASKPNDLVCTKKTSNMRCVHWPVPPATSLPHAKHYLWSVLVAKEGRAARPRWHDFVQHLTSLIKTKSVLDLRKRWQRNVRIVQMWVNWMKAGARELIKVRGAVSVTAE